MRVLIQRVKRASVRSGGALLGRIGRGLLVFVGIAEADGPDQVRWMCEKIVKLRIFEDESGKMNRSVADAVGEILVVSQFTLYGDASRGNRPSFTEAARPEKAEGIYEETVRLLSELAPIPVATGSFGAEMEVELVNDGPVTILLQR
ncbi:MAG: D-tyrosyl-tRNA(Tyr) deacylase [Deltaproteobacteria bacterium]|nr:D-tyrosyl-tRNA(Tyr) deacylase [Deltaproteobacteria bacterium]